MAVRIDYRCTGCGGVSSSWTTPSASGRAVCPACRADALPVYSAGVLLGGEPESAHDHAHGGVGGGCREALWVPAACGMHPSAARRWGALLRGDERALDREIAYQEVAVAEGLLDPRKAWGALDHAESAAERVLARRR